jgi:hypothetical protein
MEINLTESNNERNNRNIDQEELNILNGETENEHCSNENENEKEKGNENFARPIDPFSEKGIERRKLIIHLLRYKNSKLNKFLQGFNLEKAFLDTQSIEQLQLFKDDIDLSISLNSSNVFNKELFFNGILLSEKLIPKFTGLQIQGSSMVMRQNEDIDILLEEISLKNNRYIPVEMRLMASVLNVFMLVDHHNKLKDNLKEGMTKPIKKELNEKYSDL